MERKEEHRMKKLMMKMGGPVLMIGIFLWAVTGAGAGAGARRTECLERLSGTS